MFNNKKAIAEWISWVLIIAFAVALSVVVGQQLIESGKKSADSLKEYAYDTQECQNVAISIQNICQNSEALNIELSNIRGVKVDEFLLKVVDGSGDTETIKVQTALEPGNQVSVNVGKSRIADRVEIVPVIKIGDQSIMCSEKTVSEDNIQDC